MCRPCGHLRRHVPQLPLRGPQRREIADPRLAGTRREGIERRRPRTCKTDTQPNDKGRKIMALHITATALILGIANQPSDSTDLARRLQAECNASDSVLIRSRVLNSAGHGGFDEEYYPLSCREYCPIHKKWEADLGLTIDRPAICKRTNEDDLKPSPCEHAERSFIEQEIKFVDLRDSCQTQCEWERQLRSIDSGYPKRNMPRACDLIDRCNKDKLREECIGGKSAQEPLTPSPPAPIQTEDKRREDYSPIRHCSVSQEPISGRPFLLGIILLLAARHRRTSPHTRK